MVTCTMVSSKEEITHTAPRLRNIFAAIHGRRIRTACPVGALRAVRMASLTTYPCSMARNQGLMTAPAVSSS